MKKRILFSMKYAMFHFYEIYILVSLQYIVKLSFILGHSYAHACLAIILSQQKKNSVYNKIIFVYEHSYGLCLIVPQCTLLSIEKKTRRRLISHSHRRYLYWEIYFHSIERIVSNFVSHTTFLHCQTMNITIKGVNIGIFQSLTQLWTVFTNLTAPEFTQRTLNLNFEPYNGTYLIIIDVNFVISMRFTAAVINEIRQEDYSLECVRGGNIWKWNDG